MSQQPNPNSSPEDNAWAQPENTSQGASASGSTGAGTSAGAGSSTGTESSASNSWTERIEVASEQVIDTLKKLSIVLGASTDYLIFGTPDEQGPLSKAVSKANRLSENDKVWVADYLEAILKVRNNSK